MQTIFRFPDRDREAEFQGTNANGSMYFVHGVGLVCVQNIERIDYGNGRNTNRQEQHCDQEKAQEVQKNQEK